MPPKDREIDYDNSDQLADAFVISSRSAELFCKYHKISVYKLADYMKAFLSKKKVTFAELIMKNERIATLEKQLSEVNESNRRLMEREQNFQQRIAELGKANESLVREVSKSDMELKKYEQDISFLRRIIEKLIR
jgi:septal ring factor EnvC (AmiA/AmiB activator)